jgi:glycosyltransferase involved in cell wall biosynthesis
MAPDEWEWDGIKVYYPRYAVIPKVLGFTHPATMFPSILKVLMRLKKDRRCDLVNAHWVYPDGIAAVMAGKVLGIPTVLTALGCDINLYSTFRFRSPQIRWALKSAERVTAKSRALAKEIIGLGVPEERVSFIPNGIDRSLFSVPLGNGDEKARRAAAFEPGLRHILYLGRLSEEKGLPVLIEAFSGLRERGATDARLHIVGDGELRKALEAMVRGMGLSGEVLFHGAVRHKDVPHWMRGCTVLALPSLREGTPNVMLEALACGRPVVASDCGGIPDIVREGVSGYLVPAGSREGLSEALAKAIAREWDEKAISATIAHLAWPETARAYVEDYIEAMSISGRDVRGFAMRDTGGLT